MDTKGDLRQVLAGRISGYRRHARPQMGLQVWLCPIIIFYVNFLGLIRSGLQTITVDFDGCSRWPWSAAGRPGLMSISPRPGAGHLRWMAIISGWPRARAPPRAHKSEFGKGKNRNPEGGTPAPLPNVVAVGFFNVLRFFLYEQKIMGARGANI